MKIKYLIYLALFALKVSGQGGQEIKMDLPTLSPQTPTTADLGKYGELQINESSGSVSESIPLFDFYAGKINIPITLNYSGNAVKVDQDPSWTGINWSLNAGGVITREVKDKPDEISPNDRQFPTEAELDAIAGARNNVSITPWFSKMQELKSNTVDNEVDIFNYNFLGYSGSFFLDLDYNAHLIKYDKEIAITFTYGAENKSSFTIATSDGNVFSFGGAGASESSKTFVNSGAGSATSIPIAQNAFYLTKIAFINGGEVNFIYQVYDQPGCQVKLGLQESGSIRNNLDKFPTVYPKRYLQKQFERFISLKEIRSTFNDQHVFFDAIELNNCQGIVRLNNVFLKDNEDHILKQIQLAYTTLNNEDYYVNKFFLKRVLFFDSLQRLDKSYTMEYDNLDKFPKKYSFAQDELGYYNGKTNNVTTLPKLTDSYKWMNKYFELLADRSASLKHSQYGSLKKIIYPTGGSSQFEYELPFNKLVPVYNTVLNNLVYGKPNQVDYTTSNCTIIAPGSGSAYWTYQQYISAGSSGGDEETDEGTAFSTSEINEGKLHITVDGTSTGKSYVVLSAVPTNTSDQIETVIHQYSIPSNTDPALNQVVVPFEFGNIVGNFFFKIAIKRHNADVGASIKVITELAIPSLTQFDSIYYPGLRVKRVRTNNGFSEDRITRFYYNTWANRAIESYQFHPNYVYVTRQHIDRLTTCPNDERLYQSTYVDLFNLSNNSTKSIFNNDAGKFIYKNVTVSYGGDNFENGGKELKYKTYANTLPNPYATVGAFCIPTGVEVDFNGDYTSFVDCNTTESFQNSILDQEEIFDNHHTTLKRTKYDYESEVVSEITNMKIYQFCTLNDNNLYLTYKTRSYKYRSKQITATEFLNGNEITSIVSKDYDDDKVSLPKSISTTTSQGEEKVVKLFYPSDLAALDGDLNYIDGLQAKHNLSEIVKTETWLNNNLLESKRIAFNKFNSNILPSKIQFKKGSIDNEYEDRLIFEDYTPSGSPKIVYKANGAKIKYDYNAKEQVIAKTENTDLAQSNDDSTGACAIQNNNPSALVTVYNYDPITNNLISTVDPKCDVVNYKYDDFNRLIRVRDKNQNILSETKYNYQQPENIVFYNTELKQVFHRNNCTVTYAVTDYVYTVDAYKYSASSQAAADALAQAEITTKGQIAANQFGNCGFANKFIYDKIYKNDCDASVTPPSDAHVIPNDPNEPLPGALIPGYIYYGVPAGIYTSAISQDAVDELAQEHFITLGQSQANETAFCTIPNEFTVSPGYLASHNVQTSDVTSKVGINNNTIKLDFWIPWLPMPNTTDDGDAPSWTNPNGIDIGTLNSSLSRPFSNKTFFHPDTKTGLWEIKINTAGVVNLRKITPLVFTPGGGYISLTNIQFNK